MEVNQNDYYVYIWYNDDWGNVPFYVGKGRDRRYKSLNNRSGSFLNFVKRWNCHSEIIFDSMDEDSAMRLEKLLKDGFILEGYPIIDAETGYRKKVSQSIAIKNAKEKGVKFGRPEVAIEGFEKLLKMQKDGHVTVNECCKQLGISRSTWYDRVRKENVL